MSPFLPDACTQVLTSAQVHYDQDKVLHLPRGVHIVVSDWLSASLARGALHQETEYCIDLVRLAALADRPSSHVRSLSIPRRAHATLFPQPSTVRGFS